MLNTSAAKKLPTHDCPRNLANMFEDYFDSKVQRLACFCQYDQSVFQGRLSACPFQEAVLDPVIKKDSLDHEIYQNYRPISNLRFVSKATEKVVASRLTDHLEDNNLLEIFQSAYKKGHSTETALTRIRNVLLRQCLRHSCTFGPLSGL